MYRIWGTGTAYISIMYIVLYIVLYIYSVIYIYIYMYVCSISIVCINVLYCMVYYCLWYAANLRTEVLNFRGFDSSRILSLRGGILMSIGNPHMF